MKLGVEEDKNGKTQSKWKPVINYSNICIKELQNLIKESSYLTLNFLLVKPNKKGTQFLKI